MKNGKGIECPQTRLLQYIGQGKPTWLFPGLPGRQGCGLAHIMSHFLLQRAGLRGGSRPVVDLSDLLSFSIAFAVQAGETGRGAGSGRCAAYLGVESKKQRRDRGSRYTLILRPSCQLSLQNPQLVAFREPGHGSEGDR